MSSKNVYTLLASHHHTTTFEVTPHFTTTTSSIIYSEYRNWAGIHTAFLSPSPQRVLEHASWADTESSVHFGSEGVLYFTWARRFRDYVDIH